MNARSINTRALIVLSLFLVLAAFHLHGQSKDTLGEYGAVVARIGTLRNTSALFLGGRGGWIFNRTYSVGLGGYLLLNDVPARVPDSTGNNRMMASYGGLDLEYLYPLDDTFRASFQLLAGAGAIGHVENPFVNPRQHYDPFVIAEPGVSVEASLSRIFRMGVGASYRLVGWLSSAVATNSDLSGASLTLSLNAGF